MSAEERARGAAQQRRWLARARTAALLLAGVLLLAWALARESVVTCEVCVDFSGRRECARATAQTPDAAREAAQRNACERIAHAMDRELACLATPLSFDRCEAR